LWCHFSLLHERADARGPCGAWSFQCLELAVALGRLEFERFFSKRFFSKPAIQSIKLPYMSIWIFLLNKYS
jgi:hypothetical protein